jgi:hypothetical protein
MTIEIKNSLDWQKAESELHIIINQIADKSSRIQANKLLLNFEPMITKLSQLELTARRTQGSANRNLNTQLEYINMEISNLEQWVTVLLLTF